MSQFTVTKCGIGVFIVKDDKILIGKRMSKLGEGTWALPGGTMEENETPTQCAIREVAEETGLIIENPVPGPWTSFIVPENKQQYLDLLMIAKYAGGTPQVLEKDKCLEWIWCKLDEIPKPMFKPLEDLISSGFNMDRLKSYLQ